MSVDEVDDRVRRSLSSQWRGRVLGVVMRVDPPAAAPYLKFTLPSLKTKTGCQGSYLPCSPKRPCVG